MFKCVYYYYTHYFCYSNDINNIYWNVIFIWWSNSNGMTSYILLWAWLMMCIILLAYVIVTVCILIWYIILLIHEMIMIKYCNAIVIVFLIGYNIFVLYFLGVTMKHYHWMFIHIIIIFKGFKPHRLLIFSNFSLLVMWLGFIWSLLSWLTHSLYIGHWQDIKIRAHYCSGPAWFSIYRNIDYSRLEWAK